METIIATVIVSAAIGAIAGMSISTRYFDEECEKAYLTGHVDGYCKAEEELHRETDRHLGED